jgi:hypothetical protein
MDHKDIKIGSNRNFGLVFFIVFLGVAIYPLFDDGDIRLWSFVIASAFFILGIINSRLLNPLNKLWFKFGLLLAKFISPLVMGLIFFFLVSPIAIVMRLLKKDLLNLKFTKSNTYWISKSNVKSNMRDQF